LFVSKFQSTVIEAAHYALVFVIGSTRRLAATAGRYCSASTVSDLHYPDNFSGDTVKRPFREQLHYHSADQHGNNIANTVGIARSVSADNCTGPARRTMSGSRDITPDRAQSTLERTRINGLSSSHDLHFRHLG
jgi:hypothetical protein